MKFNAASAALGLPAVVIVWLAASVLALTPIEGHLRREIERDPAFEELHRSGARLDIAGRDAVVTSDFAPGPDVRRAIESAAAAVPGLRHFATDVATPVAMTPYRFAVRRDATRLTLSGGVPAGELHARLTDEGAAIVGPGRLRDELKPALAPPPAFEEAATMAIQVGAALSSGEVSIADRLVAVEGTAPDFARYNAVVATLAKLPLGYTLGPFDVTPPEARPFVWSAARAGDTVTLAGYVPSEQARTSLRAAAETDLPGLRITDAMQTARGLESGVDFTAVTHLAFSALGRLEDGKVELQGRRLDVAGRSPAVDLLAALRSEVGGRAPAGTEFAAIDLRPMKLTPYRFAAARGRAGIVLRGYVPDDGQRAALLALARDAAADLPVRDELHLAEGSPEGFGAALRVALDTLAGLAEGRATMTGRNLALDGRALYPGVAARLRERIPAALPAGWTGTADITGDPLQKPLDAIQCGDLLADLAGRDPVRFEAGHADPSARSKPVLDSLAALLRRCGPARIRVVVEAEAGKDPAAARVLAMRRAQEVATRLGSPDLAAPISAEGRLAEQPADAKLSDPKPSDAKPPDAKPPDAKPPDGKPPDAKPATVAAAKPVEDRLRFEVEPGAAP